MKKILLTAVLLTSIAGCISSSKAPLVSETQSGTNIPINSFETSEYLYIDWPGLSKDFNIAFQQGYETQDAKAAIDKTDTDIHLISLDKEGGRWKASIGAGGEEEVAINMRTGEITVLAFAREYAELGKAQKESQDTFHRDMTLGCVKAAINLLVIEKNRDFCDSEFSKISLDYNAGEIYTEVVTSLAQAVLLMKPYKVVFDSDELEEAINDSLAFKHLLNKVAEEKYIDFEHAYKSIEMDASKAISFVERYGDIKQLENHEYLVRARIAAREVELTTTDELFALKKIIKKYDDGTSDKYLQQAKNKLEKLSKDHEKQEELQRIKREKRERLAEVKSLTSILTIWDLAMKNRLPAKTAIPQLYFVDHSYEAESNTIFKTYKTHSTTAQQIRSTTTVAELEKSFLDVSLSDYCDNFHGHYFISDIPKSKNFHSWYLSLGFKMEIDYVDTRGATFFKTSLSPESCSSS